MKTSKPVNIPYTSGMGHADSKKVVRVHCKYSKLLKGDISAPLTDSPYGINFTPESDGAPWFMAKEICDVLELTSHKVSLQILRSKYEEIKVDIDGVILTYPIPDSIGRQQNTKFVSKQGMYDLILQSRKKEAFKFRIWVTSDVLPEIYKADNGRARKLTRKLTPWFVEISSSRTNKRFM